MLQAFDPGTWWLQQIHGVYNKQLRNIGYFKADTDLCKGVIELYPGEAVPKTEEMFVKNIWGVTVPVTDYCFGVSIVPKWATPEQVASHPDKITTNSNGSGISLDIGNAKIQLPTSIIVGGVAAVALLLVLRK